jgi:hypothetical protein
MNELIHHDSKKTQISFIQAKTKSTQTSIEARQFRITHPAAILIEYEASLYKVHSCCKPLLSTIILY